MNVFDLETYCDENGKVIPYCFVLFFKNKWYSGYGLNVLNSFFNILKLHTYKKEFIYVHNLNFDGFLIIEFLSSNLNLKFSLFAQNLNIYNIRVEIGNKEILFKCSYKILPLSLNNIAKGFNLENKGIFPYKFVNSLNLNYIGEIPNKEYFNSSEDYDKFSRTIKLFDLKSETISYCKNDVSITIIFLKKLKKIIKKFNIEINSCNSAPSLALKIYEKKFNKETFENYSIKVFEKFVRPSYFGGRCEVYGNPKEGDFIFHYDFTGMYGQCMMENFPYDDYKIIDKPIDFSKPGVYWIEYESINMYLPILPHHRKLDKKLMFTNGVFYGGFWYEEILLFIENGGKIKKILYGIIFEKFGKIFEDYVNFFMKLRKESSELNVFGKLMINSVYGRLGMSQIKTHTFVQLKKEFEKIENEIDVISKKELNDIVLIEAEINKKLEKKIKINNKGIRSNVLLASAITSKARIRLYRAQQSVILNGGRLLYSDTDSIFASYKKNVLNEQHGDIFWDSSKKDTAIKEALFFSPKSYALRYPDNSEIIKIKGYNQKNISFNEIKNLFLKKEKIHIKDYRFLNKRNISLSFSEIEKVFDLNIYDKRYFINNYETRAYYWNNYEYERHTI